MFRNAIEDGLLNSVRCGFLSSEFRKEVSDEALSSAGLMVISFLLLVLPSSFRPLEDVLFVLPIVLGTTALEAVKSG